MTNDPTLIHEELRQFTGDLERYRHGFNPRVIYTPGVRYLAERAGAYWLIDLIASHISSRETAAAVAKDGRRRGVRLAVDRRDDEQLLGDVEQRTRVVLVSEHIECLDTDRMESGLETLREICRPKMV